MKWFWGLFFLLIGVIYLGNNLGWWPNISGVALWQFWPLLLIIFGAGLLVRNWRFGYIIMVIITLASFGFVLAVSYGAFEPKVTFPSEQLKTTQISEEIPLNIEKAQINIDSGAVKLTVSEKTDKLIDGTFVSNVSEPGLSKNINGNEIIYNIKTDKSFRSWNNGNIKNNLDLKITDEIPVSININTGASDINLDLSSLMLSNLKIQSGASKVSLKIGDKIEKNVTADINCGASAVVVNIPTKIGAKVNISAPLSGRDLGNLNRISRDVYATDNFDNAEQKINFNIKAGLSSISFLVY